MTVNKYWTAPVPSCWHTSAALVGVSVMLGLWARQKWQEKKRGISAVKK